MPAGISWPRYISAVAGALVSMFAGAQTVHMIYQPLRDLDEKVEAEKNKLRLINLQVPSSEESKQEQIS